MSEEITRTTTPQYEYEDDVPDLKGIPTINHIIHWFHELLLALSVISLGIGLVSAGIAIRDGSFHDLLPKAALWFSISATLGVEPQVVGLYKRATVAYRQHRWKQMVGWTLPAIPLTVFAIQVFFLMQQMSSTGMTEAQAVASMGGMTMTDWNLESACLAGGVFALIAISAWTRPPKRVVTAAEKVKDTIEKAELEAARLEAEARVHAAKMASEALKRRAEIDKSMAQAELHQAQVQAGLKTAAVGAISVKDAWKRTRNAQGAEDIASLGAIVPTGVHAGLPQPRMIDSALVPASFEQNGDDDDTPPPAPTDGPRRRGRPRGSRNSAGRSIELVSMESASPSGALLSTRANAGRSRKKDNPVYQRQVARAQQLLREAEAQSLLGRRVTLSVQNLVDDPMLKEQGIAVTSKSIATSIITDAKHRNEVEDLKAELRAS